MQVTIGKSNRAPAVPPVVIPQVDPNPANPSVALSEEDRTKRAAELYEVQGWGHPAPEKADPPAPADAAPPAADPAAPVVLPEKVLGTEEMIQRTASETARQTALEVSKVIRPAATEPAQPAAPAFEMDPSDAEDYRVIQFLEKSGDAKFKGKSAEFEAYVRKYYAYQDEWLKANAGKEFDPDAEEHAAWFEANQPDIDPEDLTNGKIDLRVEEAYEKRVKPERDAARARDAFEENLPAIAATVTSHVGKFASAVDPELAKVLYDADGKLVMSEENVKKLAENDPIAGEIMDEMVRTELEPLLLELEKTAIPEMNYRLNPAKNRAHAAIDQYRQILEKEIVGDATRIVVDGKQFLTIQQMAEMRSSITGTPEEKQARFAEIESKYWTVTVDHVEEQIVKSLAAKAKTRIEKQDKLAKSKYAKGDAPNPSTVKTDPLPEPTPVPAKPAPTPATTHSNGKPKPPSVAAPVDVATSAAPGGGNDNSFGKEATKLMFG